MRLPASQAQREWYGACHCGRCRFEITADIDHARICNCSICQMRGALMFRVAEAQFQLLTPWEGLQLYEWGTGSAKDYFCKYCGILPFRRPRAATPEERVAPGYTPFSGWAVNLRCIEGLDPSILRHIAVDGRALPLPDQLP